MIAFYSVALFSSDSSKFQDYALDMVFVNVACSCLAQVLLSLIYGLHGSPIEIYEKVNKDGWKSVWEVRRNDQLILRLECPREITPTDGDDN